MSLRKRFFAWMLKQGDTFNRKLYNAHKKDLFQGIEGTVVEIGPGTGINFPYFPSGSKWIGIEPNDAFHEGLMIKAKENGINASLVNGNATNIPLPDENADAVVCTLVLCSVDEPKLAISEMKRILKPGGKLFFIEHVGAVKESGLRKAQNVFNPINRLMADGCNCNRETWTSLNEGGFSDVHLTHLRVKGAMKLHSPHILGYAVK